MLDGWSATRVGYGLAQREALSAKRFRVPGRAFADGERIRAFDAQSPICGSLRAVEMQRELSSILTPRTVACDQIAVMQEQPVAGHFISQFYCQ